MNRSKISFIGTHIEFNRQGGHRLRFCSNKSNFMVNHIDSCKKYFGLHYYFICYFNFVNLIEMNLSSLSFNYGSWRDELVNKLEL